MCKHSCKEVVLLNIYRRIKHRVNCAYLDSKRNMNDSERSEECIDFTMMCVFFFLFFFIFVSVTTFWSSKSAPILKSGPCFG
ncbi:Uncharacterized protein FWK35_00021042 [Aphis craccivora]|uniref:Uncharacterized protein n=1 Tax=Aphis craccivora TaxID=307492 RepID=A0A6G0W1D4_APHCR|nr:Uncharacterized protein FWK35_00021042 [Aphis craccivora]